MMSELVEEWWEREDHPLMNSLILIQVFKHLREKDLKKCRLVCKAWNTLTIPFTRNAFEVRISGNNSMEDFVEVFRSNTLGIPYARFQLGCFSMTEGIGQEFLQLCGNMMKSVRFTGVGNWRVEDLSEFLKSTPKLEIFEIPSIVRCLNLNDSLIKLFPYDTKPKLLSLEKLSVCSFDDRNKFVPSYLEELITAAENISSLRLSDCITFDGPTANVGEMIEIMSGSLEVLKLIEKLGRESSIQELIISYTNKHYSEYFELLHKMIEKPNGLKLKRFGFGLPGSSSEENQGLFQLISLLKDTLEYLRIESSTANTFAMFPKMSRLTKLSVKFPGDLISRLFNLKEIFPVLKALELGQLRHHSLNEFFPESEPCPIMNSLVFNDNGFLEVDGFNQLLVVFPNLTTLAINVQEDDLLEILKQIWLEMKQLKSLSISSTIQTKSVAESLNSVLTGISAHALQEIKTSVNILEQMTSRLGRSEMILKLRTQHCQLPSIGNLTELRSLTLNMGKSYRYFRPRPVGMGLTDMTGYLGLYSMKRLKNLKLSNCEFSKTCCEILTKDLELESWSFKDCLDREIIPSE